MTDRYRTPRSSSRPITPCSSPTPGAAAGTPTTPPSRQMDDIIWQHRHPHLPVPVQLPAATGLRGPQAWAKNIVGVGGVYHYNTDHLADDCWCSGALHRPGRRRPHQARPHPLLRLHLHHRPSRGLLVHRQLRRHLRRNPHRGGTGGWCSRCGPTTSAEHPPGSTVFEKPHASTSQGHHDQHRPAVPFTGRHPRPDPCAPGLGSPQRGRASTTAHRSPGSSTRARCCASSNTTSTRPPCSRVRASSWSPWSTPTARRPECGDPPRERRHAARGGPRRHQVLGQPRPSERPLVGGGWRSGHPEHRGERLDRKPAARPTG